MIRSWLRNESAQRSPVLDKADAALHQLDELIERLRHARHHPVRGLISDLVEYRHNVPYVTTLFEANEEMKSAAQHHINGG